MTESQPGSVKNPIEISEKAYRALSERIANLTPYTPSKELPDMLAWYGVYFVRRASTGDSNA